MRILSPPPLGAGAGPRQVHFAAYEYFSCLFRSDRCGFLYLRPGGPLRIRYRSCCSRSSERNGTGGSLGNDGQFRFRSGNHASSVQLRRVGREILPRLAEDQSSGVAGNRVLSDVSCDIGVAVHGIRGSWTLRRVEVHGSYRSSRIHGYQHFLIGLDRRSRYVESEAVHASSGDRPGTKVLPFQDPSCRSSSRRSIHEFQGGSTRIHGGVFSSLPRQGTRSIGKPRKGGYQRRACSGSPRRR